MDKQRNPHRFFYGYVVVTVCFIVMLLMHGTFNSYGVFFNGLQVEFGWNRTLISGASSLGWFLTGVFGIVAGRLNDRFGPRLVLTICGLGLGLGYALMSQINAAWQLYLFLGVIAGSCTGSGDVVPLSTTARWFSRRRGMITGVVKVGTGAGTFIIPLLASWLISNHGWRNSYIILGIIASVGVILVAQLLARDPSQKGLKAYGADEAGIDSSNQARVGTSAAEAVRTKQFWATCAMYFMVCYCTTTMGIHIVPYALDMGIPATPAAALISTIGATSILGRLVMGSSGDRLGNRRVVFINFLVLIAAMVWLQFAKDIWGLYLFAAIDGFAHGGFYTLVSPLVADLFGMKSHGAILGMALFALQVGGAVGPLVAGGIFDATHSYHLAFLMLVIVSIIGCLLSWYLLTARTDQRLGTEGAPLH